MTDKNLSEKQAAAIRAIMMAPDTDLNSVLALLAEEAATECETDEFCAKVQMELMEVYSMIVGRPGILRDPAMRGMAGRIVDLLRGFRMMALNK